MAKRRLIQRPSGQTPAGALASGERATDIPEDLLQEAGHRLGLAALLGVALWSVGVVADHLAMRALDPSHPRWRQLHFPDAVVAVAIIASLALFLYSRSPHRDPRRLLDLGLLYLIVTSLEIGIIWHWSPVTATMSVRPEFTWVGSLVLIFAAIIPNPPWKTLVAGVIAASMMPLGMVLSKLEGRWDFGAYSNILLMHYPDYIMVGVSVVISRVVTRLGQHITKAREMGSYQLGELLGKGGMGEVYLATHRMLARPAAIKLIRPEMICGDGNEAAQVAVKRFRREAEAAASLRSPHTVELYDFGVTEDQTLYFVMELLKGMDLESLVKEHGVQPANRVIFILKQVCESLDEAHSRGLVHRDIKPANIHLGTLGLQHDFVKVLDFGLVKSAEAGAEQSLATGADATPGTPAYMAPEMALGGEVDGRADLYALGCVAYFLLTRHVVFEAATALQAVAKHVSDTPIPPSQRNGSVSIPPEFEQIIMQLLAKKPSDRIPNAAALAEALGTIRVTPWTEADARDWWGKNKSA